MERTYVLVGVGAASLVALAAFVATRRASAAGVGEPEPRVLVDDLLEEISVTARRIASSTFVGPVEAWAAPEKYRASIRGAETANSLPPRLLERLLYQESRYRADIISGAVVSSAGAVGIAQIVPRWHPDVNPLDATASIRYAAKYLAQLRTQFGDWRKALAAYNWGPGNLSKVNTKIPLWLSQTPTETRRYVEQITGDVPV